MYATVVIDSKLSLVQRKIEGSHPVLVDVKSVSFGSNRGGYSEC